MARALPTRERSSVMNALFVLARSLGIILADLVLIKRGGA